MLNKSIDSITRNDIESLVFNQVPESRTLEYKEKLSGNSDEDKREFLKDVSAFANTSGGDIIYGISEQRDSGGKTTGFPDQAKGLSGINADEQKRRLDSILQDALDPRIPGIRIEAIDGFTEGSIIIIIMLLLSLLLHQAAMLISVCWGIDYQVFTLLTQVAATIDTTSIDS